MFLDFVDPTQKIGLNSSFLSKFFYYFLHRLIINSCNIAKLVNRAVIMDRESYIGNNILGIIS